MQLILFRHGIAIDREDPDCPPDPERYLTKEGEHLTRQAASGLKAMKVSPDRILTSPLLRAVQTAKIAADVLGLKGPELVVTDQLLSQQDPAEFLSSLSQYDGASVLAVGHAPHIDEIVARGIGISNGTVTSLKKAGAALVEFGPAMAIPGRLVWVLPAGTLRRISKKT